MTEFNWALFPWVPAEFVSCNVFSHIFTIMTCMFMVRENSTIIFNLNTSRMTCCLNKAHSELLDIKTSVLESKGLGCWQQMVTGFPNLSEAESWETWKSSGGIRDPGNKWWKSWEISWSLGVGLMSTYSIDQHFIISGDFILLFWFFKIRSHYVAMANWGLLDSSSWPWLCLVPWLSKCWDYKHLSSILCPLFHFDTEFHIYSPEWPWSHASLVPFPKCWDSTGGLLPATAWRYFRRKHRRTGYWQQSERMVDVWLTWSINVYSNEHGWWVTCRIVGNLWTAIKLKKGLTSSTSVNCLYVLGRKMA